ncbi:DUF309 domain-containing protein [Mammaliicoccus sp. Dog046]|uniref:DUF309 domain-containing protein n=1 Tax=Mammaliicoccus sp. Dog046 TaxID=3034233 RepID=UPI002B256FC1|nr:DUF309 domain-containing protein [Mammaliicoccus sp. Dog046]WQK84292.1 DUF309 domain-containing protein [Mammaliicoccus sp. Dog046]
MEIDVINFHYNFHVHRHYFECHDILEEYWKAQPHFSKNDAVVSLILFSTACYHYRRENIKGALKTFNKSLQIAILNPSFEYLGVEREAYISVIQSQILKINQNKKYKSIQLPLTDECLYALNQTFTDFEYNTLPDVSDYIKHHHLLRDRTEVIEQRNAAYLNRRSKR